MKLALTNVTFRHNSACVMIKKWRRFKRVIKVRLVHISCFLLKTEILERLFLNDLLS